MADEDDEIEAVLDFWFGTPDELGRPPQDRKKRWFGKDPDFDRTIRECFSELHGAVARGERDGWLATPRGRLAHVIVLDQLSRNMFRDRPEMYAWDGPALEAALEGIDAGDDAALGPYERTFLYMPLMHAEDLVLQERCVALFARLRDEVPDEVRGYVENGLDFAERHRDIVKRFGRFPHRNAILGRESTDEERAFLEEPGSSF